MNAQNIIKMCNKISKRFSFTPQVTLLPENEGLLDDIYNLAREIAPREKTKFDIVWDFWLWTDKGSYEEFADTFKSHFTYLNWDKIFTKEEEWTVDYEEMKEQWPLYFPDDVVWFKLKLRETQDTSKIRTLSLEDRVIISTRKCRCEQMDMSPLLKWILEAEQRCVEMIKQGTYTDYISKNLPYEHRSGVTKMLTFWKYVPEDKERIFGDIDPQELKIFQEWDEYEDSGWEQMTKNNYFDICNHLYDLLDLKTKYPISKKDAPDEPLTPEECYLAYAANYDSAQPFKELEGDSAEAFDKFIVEGNTEHHTWEVCLAPNIHLYPLKIDEKYYIKISFHHNVTNYDHLIHLALELRKRGVPIVKPNHILEKMSGEHLIAIEPYGDEYNYQYARKHRLRTKEGRCLPRGINEELLKEIKWFPIEEWRVADGES